MSGGIFRVGGDPLEKFRENAIDMLRVVRTAAVKGFKIDERVLVAIRVEAEEIRKVSCEEINFEFNEIIMSDRPRYGIKLMEDTKLLRYILPELDRCVGVKQFSKHHKYSIFEHIIKALDYTDKDIIVRLAVLMHDIAKPVCMSLEDGRVGHFYGHDVKGAEMAEVILKRLGYSQGITDRVVKLVRNHMIHGIKTKKSVKKIVKRVGKDIDRLISVVVADSYASSGVVDYKEVVRIKRLIREVKEDEEGLDVKDLEVNGYDLIDLGFKGKDIGVVLKGLLDKVAEGSLLNRRKDLLEKVLEIRDKSIKKV